MSFSTNLRHKIAAFQETWGFDNRWELYFQEIQGKKGIRVYRMGSVEAIADHATGDHLGGIRGALASMEYRSLLRLVDIETVRNVLDLGAHIGSFPMLLKILNAPLQKVVCVEPNPDSQEKLRFNLAHNRLPAVVVAGAVSNDLKDALLFRNTTSTGFSLLPPQEFSQEAASKVCCYTLDNLISDHFSHTKIDLCKVDIEGAEFMIFDEMKQESLQNIHHLICEVHPKDENTVESLTATLKMLGFEKSPVAYGDTRHFVNSRFDV